MTASTKKDPFGLAEMGQLDPPKDQWPTIRAALESPVNTRRWPYAVPALAAAVLAAVLIWQLKPVEMTPEIGPQPVQAQPIDRLVKLSRGMENRLSEYRQAVGTLPSDTAVKVMELEDLIAVLDSQIVQAPRSETLWYQRVTLIGDLLSLYMTQNETSARLYASL